MEYAEIIGREITPIHERNRERIAERDHHCCRRRWCEAHWAGFRRRWYKKNTICLLTKRALGAPSHGNQRNTIALCMVEQVRELAALARVRQHQERVGGCHHSEIAVTCFCWMNELGRRSG